MRLTLIIGCLFALTSSAKTELLPASKINALKQRKCAFLHVWATSSPASIKEMPALLRILQQDSRIQPILIDVSAPFVQENFSKKWMVQLNPPFITYLKPPGEYKTYLRAIDKGWTGSLPYSVLFDRGVRKKVWLGQLPLTRLKEEIFNLCR